MAAPTNAANVKKAMALSGQHQGASHGELFGLLNLGLRHTV
jgi:hypothetical protein